MMPLRNPFALLLFFALTFPLAAQEDTRSVFGSKDSSVAGLIGIMYDLKQTQKRESTGVTPSEYGGIIREFLEKNWDESVLNRYFRAANPLYTTQIFIPLMGAGEAPKAFEVGNIMKASVWLVHYKGQVSAPEDGNYRFISYADDLIVVGVNGKIVCNGSRHDTKVSDWKSPEGKNAGRGGNGHMVYGDWITLKKDELIDLDVIVGERPGGEFCAFLLYEKQGVEYPREGNTTLYPVFQLAPFETRQHPENKAPLFSKSSQVWQGHQ